MKKTALLIFAAIMFAGCNKENVSVADGSGNSGTAEYTLEATLEQPEAGDETMRSELAKDGASVLWQEGDEVRIAFVQNFGGAAPHGTTERTFVATSGGKTTTKLKLDEGQNAIPEGYVPRWAMYPADAPYTFSYGSTADTGNKFDVNYISFHIPYNSLTWTSNDTFAPQANICYGEVTDGHIINFKNLLAMVKVTVKNERNEDIRRVNSQRITLCANKGIALDPNCFHPLAGGYIYDKAGTAYSSIAIPDGIIPANSTRVFYFPICPREDGTLQLWVKADDDTPSHVAVGNDHVFAKTNAAKAYERNKIYAGPTYTFKADKDVNATIWGAKR